MWYTGRLSDCRWTAADWMSLNKISDNVQKQDSAADRQQTQETRGCMCG
jgi:hypothetical protein